MSRHPGGGYVVLDVVDLASLAADVSQSLEVAFVAVLQLIRAQWPSETLIVVAAADRSAALARVHRRAGSDQIEWIETSHEAGSDTAGDIALNINQTAPVTLVAHISRPHASQPPAVSYQLDPAGVWVLSPNGTRSSPPTPMAPALATAQSPAGSDAAATPHPAVAPSAGHDATPEPPGPQAAGYARRTTPYTDPDEQAPPADYRRRAPQTYTMSEFAKQLQDELAAIKKGRT